MEIMHAGYEPLFPLDVPTEYVIFAFLLGVLVGVLCSMTGEYREGDNE